MDDLWYSEQVVSLECIRFIIQALLDNMPDCLPTGAHFIGNFPHAFAEVLLDNLSHIGDN